MTAPDVLYAKTADGAHLAFTVVGDGPIDVVEVGNGSNMSIEAASDQLRWQGYVEGLAAFTRLIRFDPRGIGLSDPLSSEGATIEQYASDTLAVMSAAGSDEAALLATGHSGPVAVFLAATNPSAIRALVLINAYARLLRTYDYPAGIPAEVYDRFFDSLVEPASTSVAQSAAVDDLPSMAPSRVDDVDFRSWWRQAGHRGASPSTARAIFTMSRNSDVRDLLRQVQAPTLVLHAVGNNFVRVDHGRYLAAHISKARFIEIDSADHLPWTNDTDTVGEIEEFLTGTRHVPTGNRRLATVLFTDIVESTVTARSLGDHVWRDRLDRHDLLAERQISRFGGQVVKQTGDGVLATFEGPAAAIRCARAMTDGIAQIGVSIRCGVHVGEIEQRGDDIAGIAVHIAARVCSAAQPGETLVSRTVTDLVAGSGIDFEDRGAHELKGVPGSWNLFAVTGGSA
ncbi:MAG TPA: adenylate/guanylate cyclase domain-containing protein [Acidimicrobiales bacterium]|nr:adenylate/guanylate cyclase domain-containing protein [Acidimicrobiales bacterium]